MKQHLERLRLPVIAAPMFLGSGPALVVECCRSGIVGSFPALNQRTTAELRTWLRDIRMWLEGDPGALPFAMNLVVHPSNQRLSADLDLCVEERVPIVITSLGATGEVVKRIQGYGGLVFHDVTSRRHAEKAAEAGVDGIIAVAAGAGGHGGTLSPFALLPEIRQVFDGTLVLGGAITRGADILAAQILGADLVYMGTRFLATCEALVPDAHKAMIVESRAADVQYTNAFSGINGNYLRPAIKAAGLDPDNLPQPDGITANGHARPWKDIFSAGQGVGLIGDLPPASHLIARLHAEYVAAREAMVHREIARTPATGVPVTAGN
jgi:nitronate monooxygenase